jgi:hypothetical protein
MAIVLFLVILIAGAAIIQFSGLPEYEPGKVKFQVTATPNRVAEGARLSSMLCSGCHMGADNALSGRLMSEAPPEFGTVYSANITQHRENGIGSWTDSEIAYFLRTGVKRDGRFAPVYMPRFVNLSEEIPSPMENTSSQVDMIAILVTVPILRRLILSILSYQRDSWAEETNYWTWQERKFIRPILPLILKRASVRGIMSSLKMPWFTANCPAEGLCDTQCSRMLRSMKAKLRPFLPI